MITYSNLSKENKAPLNMGLIISIAAAAAFIITLINTGA